MFYFLGIMVIVFIIVIGHAVYTAERTPPQD